MARASTNTATKPKAFAIAAHPDDIEFLMAGTLLLLGRAGFELHYMNVSSGNCGSMKTGPARTRAIRRRESQNAAKILGATWHPSIADDLEITYNIPTLRKLAATIRQVAPTVLLIPSPQDYMEDHINTARLAVTAAFARAMPNFRTAPARRPLPPPAEITLYHALPHGLRGPLGEVITPELFVETTSVHDKKRAALAAHASQKDWLDATQGMGSYLRAMDDMSRTIGEMSGRYEHAEAWRRHNPIGFAPAETDPLRTRLLEHTHLNQYYRRAQI